MVTKITVVSALFVLILSGCTNYLLEAQNNLMKKEITVVISPGFKVLINGNPTVVFGHDFCPKENKKFIIFDLYQNIDSNACVVMDKKSDFVKVSYDTRTGMITENWKVIRAEEVKYGVRFTTAFMYRPNGSIVVLADN